MYHILRYTGELKREAEFFIEYAKDAVAYIKAGHWGKEHTGACIDTIFCGSENEIRYETHLHFLFYKSYLRQA